MAVARVRLPFSGFMLLGWRLRLHVGLKFIVFTHILLQLLAQSSTAFIFSFIFSFIFQLPFLSLMHRSKKPKYIELYLATFELYLIKPYYHHRVQPIFTRPTSARHLAALVLLRRARETNEHRTSQR